MGRHDGMKLLRSGALFCAAGLISLFLTEFVWNGEIENRAFHCTDDVGFGVFWQDISEHEQAGDTVAPGWTWDKLRYARVIYAAAFFLIWGAFVACYFVATRAKSTADRGLTT